MSEMNYKRVDRSDGTGILYFFIRIFGHLPTAPLRELLMIPCVRKAFFRFFKHLMDKQLKTRTEFPRQIQEDKHDLMMAIFEMVEGVVFEAPNKHVRRKRMQMFLDIFFKRVPKIIKFKKENGDYPPGFLTIGIGKFCNLKCTGCYASSDTAAAEKLSWEVMNWMINQKKELWGSYFTVITGGEPLVWRSEGKDIFDLAAAHPDQCFMFYTNGTLINEKICERINELGNINPSISVEGFEAETDERRGKGTYAKIINAMKLLKKHNIGFGISITATNQNAELLSKDDIYDFYFKEMGASFGWMFQYMPIGRGVTTELLVTPDQREKLYREIHHLIRDKKYFMVDFWNSGTCVEGCISAGRYGGYLYVNWNGDVAACTFNPYAPANVNDTYKAGKTLNDILNEPYFKAIRNWMDEYGLRREKDKIGNWITPCICKDHYRELRPMIDKYKPKPLDESAQEALDDPAYKEAMFKHADDLAAKFNPIWEKEYLNSDKNTCGSSCSCNTK